MAAECFTWPADCAGLYKYFNFLLLFLRTIQLIRISGINCYSSSVLILEFIQQAFPYTVITAYFSSVHKYVVKVQSTILVKRVCIFRFPEADGKGFNVVYSCHQHESSLIQ
jgi:hypothetical protein